MTREQKETRWREFWPLGEVLDNDPIAYKIAQSYAMGEIATLNEALFQMAIHCSRQGRLKQEREVDFLMRTTIPTIIPTNQ